MRLFSAVQRWADLKAKPVGETYPLTLRIGDTLGLPETVTLPSPLTVVSGLNGAGKTRLLRELAIASSGRVVALHQLLSYLQRDLALRDDIGELLEESGAKVLDGFLLQSVTDLVRRDYEEVRWYSVDIVDSPFRDIVGDDVVPAFVVRHQGATYDFRTMGLGELSAHVLMWLLSYSRENDAPLLLLDEPEAFLPPPSRDVVLSYLLESSLKGRRVVVASHSLELIQPAVAAGAALILSRSAGKIDIRNASEADVQERVAGLFGQTQAPQVLLLCEDESAYVFSDELLRQMAPRIWSVSRFLWLTGFGNLRAVWNNMPRPARLPEGVLPFAFIADGDKAAEVAALVAEHAATMQAVPATRARWPIVALPADPDVLMKEAAERDIPGLARALRLAPAYLAGLLEQRQGREAHNWVLDLIEASEVDRQVALRALSACAVDMLMADEARLSGAQDAFEDINGLLRVIGPAPG